MFRVVGEILRMNAFFVSSGASTAVKPRGEWGAHRLRLRSGKFLSAAENSSVALLTGSTGARNSASYVGSTLSGVSAPLFD